MGSFGLGVAMFYLNFLYRAYGYDDLALGTFIGAEAIGVAAGVVVSRRFAPGRSRRWIVISGGAVVALGIAGTLVGGSFALLAASAALVGLGGIVATASGAALLADATEASARSSRFGQQIALGTMAAFAASVIAGLLARPIAGVLGTGEADLATLRAVVALGGVVGAASAIPVLLIRDVPVARTETPAGGRGLLARFAAVEMLFGFGAAGFLPFTNLFFADRFGLGYGTIGLALGSIAVGGSLGALVHGRLVASRLGHVRGVAAVQLASLPFALLAVLTGEVAVVVAALAIRAGLMYGAQATWSAYTMSSFTPAERAGAGAALALAWNVAAGVGSSASGAIRNALGPDGFTVNMLVLVACYAMGSTLVLRLFSGRPARGDEPRPIWPASPE